MAPKKTSAAPGAVGPTFGMVPDMAPPRVGGGTASDITNALSSFVGGLSEERTKQQQEAYRKAAAQLAQQREQRETASDADLRNYRKGEIDARNRDIDVRERELAGTEAGYQSLLPSVEADIKRLTGKDVSPLPPGIKGVLAYRFRIDQLNAAQAASLKGQPTGGQKASGDEQVRRAFERGITSKKADKTKSIKMGVGQGKMTPETLGVLAGGAPDLTHADSADVMKGVSKMYSDPQHAGFVGNLAKELNLEDASSVTRGKEPLSGDQIKTIARLVSQQHPGWTREQKAAEVQRRVEGAK